MSEGRIDSKVMRMSQEESLSFVNKRSKRIVKKLVLCYGKVIISVVVRPSGVVGKLSRVVGSWVGPCRSREKTKKNGEGLWENYTRV